MKWGWGYEVEERKDGLKNQNKLKSTSVIYRYAVRLWWQPVVQGQKGTKHVVMFNHCLLTTAIFRMLYCKRPKFNDVRE